MKKPSLLIIFLSVFIDLVGFGIVMPLLPLYGDIFLSGNDLIPENLHGLIIGTIIASFSAMQFLFSPVWGRLSDRMGRRPVILISNAGSVISYALFAAASLMAGTSGLVILLISRIFAGICGANLSVASAYIADVTPREKRSKGMALIGIAFGLGFMLGPAIGAFSSKLFGVTGPGWVAAAFCAFNFFFGVFVLAESRRPESAPAATRPKAGQWGAILRRPQVGILIWVFFLATFAFTCFEATFPLVLKRNFADLTTDFFSQVGYFFTYCGVLAVVVQGGLIGPFVKRFGEAKLIVASLFILGIGLAVVPFQTATLGLMAGLTLIAVGSALNRPPIFGLISLHSNADEQGAILGVAQSAGSLARILGPIFAGSFFPSHPPVPYVICALIAVGIGGVAWLYLCPRPSVINQEPATQTHEEAGRL